MTCEKCNKPLLGLGPLCDACLKPVLFEAVCDQCGGQALVPFQPDGVIPVYCRTCFLK